jgi:hypothetical protein
MNRCVVTIRRARRRNDAAGGHGLAQFSRLISGAYVGCGACRSRSPNAKRARHFLGRDLGEPGVLRRRGPVELGVGIGRGVGVGRRCLRRASWRLPSVGFGVDVRLRKADLLGHVLRHPRGGGRASHRGPSSTGDDPFEFQHGPSAAFERRPRGGLRRGRLDDGRELLRDATRPSSGSPAGIVPERR